MSDWVTAEASARQEQKWVHVPTGVVLFVREHAGGYGVYVRATGDGPVEQVSIGDPETGRFRTFDDREQAVDWADEWKASDAVLKALKAADPTASTSDDQQ